MLYLVGALVGVVAAVVVVVSLVVLFFKNKGKRKSYVTEIVT
jgi:high-affinity Fe2+/Pb2+ permease